MPAEESTPAIVLRTRDYAEADRIVTLLTRDFGKLSGIAKGAKASRRRFERKLEPFTQAMLYFRRRPQGQLVFITRAERLDHAPGEFDELGRIALGSYMLELSDALTTEEAEALDAYDTLVAAMGVLSRNPATMALRQAFELKVLQATGFGLDFGRCRLCGSDSETHNGWNYFVPARGGVVCAQCRSQVPENGIRLSVADTAATARLGAVGLEQAAILPSPGADSALAVARFLATILDRKLRSLDFLNSIL